MDHTLAGNLKMNKILVLLLFCICSVFCQEPQKTVSKKYLHISTIPSNADVYINELKPDHSKNPQATSSMFIPIDEKEIEDNHVLVSLFKADFNDTTIQVTLSDKDTSYLIVSMRPNYNENLKNEQEKVLKKRYNKNFGRKMIFGSFIPLAVSAVSGIITYNEIDKAKTIKKKMEKNLLGNNDDFSQAEKNFKIHRDKAETAHTVMNVGVSLGLSLLAVGIILSF